jgi:glutamine amidotransferase
VDGWGLAVYEGRGLRSFLDTKACARSPVARFVREYPVRTRNCLAHIRCATHGLVGLENVHPFSRELWGIPWCFAHNGEAAAFAKTRYGHHSILLGKATEEDLVFHAIGDTDSEALFCMILNALHAEFQKPPTLPELYNALQRFMDELVEKDENIINNFLLGCGPSTLICYSWPGRLAGSDVWNGLHYTILEPPYREGGRGHQGGAHLEDKDYSVDFEQEPCRHVFESARTTKEERQQHADADGSRIAIVATKPRPLSTCTDAQGWIEFERGELVVFDEGVPYSKVPDLEKLERMGRGLSSRCFDGR